MPLTTSTFAQLQALQATQYSSQATLPANTNPGSSLGAIFNANALLALNVQSEIQYIDAVARLATSTGADVDSFCLPFGIVRLAAVAATGTCTLTTFTPVNGSLVIPTGGVLTTTSGIQFTIQADTANTTGIYSTTQNGYVIGNGLSSGNVLVTCATAGTIGNAAAGTITQIYNGTGVPPITGINTVTNAAACTGGVNSESDAALIARFASVMSTGLVATPNAIAAAILGVQAGLTYSIGDSLDVNGNSSIGHVSIYVNVAGTGTAPSSTLVANVLAAVNAVRSAGVLATVSAPSLTTVTVSATLHCSTALGPTMAASATTALKAYINGLGLNPTGGSTEIDYFTVAQTLLQVTGMTKIDALQVNGGTADIIAPFGTQFVAGTPTFTVVSP